MRMRLSHQDNSKALIKGKVHKSFGILSGIIIEDDGGWSKPADENLCLYQPGPKYCNSGIDQSNYLRQF